MIWCIHIVAAFAARRNILSQTIVDGISAVNGNFYLMNDSVIEVVNTNEKDCVVTEFSEEDVIVRSSLEFSEVCAAAKSGSINVSMLDAHNFDSFVVIKSGQTLLFTANFSVLPNFKLKDVKSGNVGIYLQDGSLKYIEATTRKTKKSQFRLPRINLFDLMGTIVIVSKYARIRLPFARLHGFCLVYMAFRLYYLVL